MTAPLVGFTILIESGVLLPGLGRPSASRDCCTALTPDLFLERTSGLHLERQWELYRRSVAEGMPDSDYKAAVLAGIAHHLMRLDSIEASRSPFVEKAARARTDRSHSGG